MNCCLERGRRPDLRVVANKRGRAAVSNPQRTGEIPRFSEYHGTAGILPIHG